MTSQTTHSHGFRFHVIYNTTFNIHTYRHTLPVECKYHILYWSVEYFLSRVATDKYIYKDNTNYQIKLLDSLTLDSLTKLSKDNPCAQLALSFRTCPNLPSLVLVKLGDKY